MSVLNVTTRAGDDAAVPADVGMSVMEIIRDAGFDELLASCGGSMACATCHVYVDPKGPTPKIPMSEDESDLLDASDHRTEHSRLSCQILFSQDLDGMHVTIAPAD
jgi:2Fe-2S ferredoxin